MTPTTLQYQAHVEPALVPEKDLGYPPDVSVPGPTRRPASVALAMALGVLVIEPILPAVAPDLVDQAQAEPVRRAIVPAGFVLEPPPVPPVPLADVVAAVPQVRPSRSGLWLLVEPPIEPNLSDLGYLVSAQTPELRGRRGQAQLVIEPVLPLRGLGPDTLCGRLIVTPLLSGRPGVGPLLSGRPGVEPLLAGSLTLEPLISGDFGVQPTLSGRITFGGPC